jgi:hypothetical protein
MSKLKLSDGTWYPFIPTLCDCKGRNGCISIINKKETKYALGHYVNVKNPMHDPDVAFKVSGELNPSKRPEVAKKIGDALRGVPKSKESVEKSRIGRIKLFLINNCGEKEIYPPIPDLCWCKKCNEIVWGGNTYIQGHNVIGKPASTKGKPRTYESKKKQSITLTKTCLYDSSGNKEIYPPIPVICYCMRPDCYEILWGGQNWVNGHHIKGIQISDERRLKHKIASTKICLVNPDGSKEIYPPIFDICHCKKCNEIVWGGDDFINGHQSIGRKGIKGEASHFKRPEVREKIRIANTKLFLLRPDGSKEIYPPIPDLCHCSNPICHEIVYGGKEYVPGHNGYIDGSSFEPYCHKFNDEFREQVRERDGYICQNCGRTQEEELQELHRILAVHHIHYDKQNCEPDCITLCHRCNIKVNYNRKYNESLFMNKLNDRNLLIWSHYRELRIEYARKTYSNK